MGFSRQHWSALLCPSPGELPDSGTEPMSWEAHLYIYLSTMSITTINYVFYFVTSTEMHFYGVFLFSKFIIRINKRIYLLYLTDISIIYI